jgi:hypothetical protein
MLVMAYFSFFHCHLLYGNMFWGNSASAAQVLLWQKKALRIMAGVSRRESCKPLFKHFSILTVQSIFIFQNLLYVKQNINQFSCRSSIHDYPTRQSQDLVIARPRLQKFANSHKYLQIKMFNKLPENFRSLDMNVFKRQLHSILVENAFYSLDDFLTFNFRAI